MICRLRRAELWIHVAVDGRLLILAKSSSGQSTTEQASFCPCSLAAWWGFTGH